MTVLKITDLTLRIGQEVIVNKLDLSIQEGEWLALIGESGSGKSVTALSIGGLLPKSFWVEKGTIEWCGTSLLSLSENEMGKLRGKGISYVFQDYTGMFAPFIPIGKQMDETLRAHQELSKNDRKELIWHYLEEVQLPAERVFNSYPCQLSGGQMQRVSIAAAMMLQPKLLIADEPTTALDKITGEEILGLLSTLKKRTQCAILFISHDLRTVKRHADKVVIMRKGQVVEAGEKQSVLHIPQHEYTKQLLGAIPPLKHVPSRLLTGFQNLARKTLLASTRGDG